jgi:hypothetical protein
LESGALSTDDFKKFAKNVVLFLHVTSYVDGAKYPHLLQKKGGRGFPYLVVMDAEGNVISKVKGARTVENFQKAVDAGNRYQTLSAKKDRTPAEDMEFFKLQWGMGNLTPEQAHARIDAMKGLTDAQKADLLIPVEIKEHLPKSRDPAAAQAAGKYYAQMYKEGRKPKTEADMQPYYILMLSYAEAQKDVKLFETALGELKKEFGSNPNATRFFAFQEKRLEKLKQAAVTAKDSK